MSDFTTFIGIDTVRCASCGVPFGMASGLQQARRDDLATFYCPNGHGQTFKESEADRLRKQVASFNERISVMVTALDASKLMYEKLSRKHKRLIAARKRSK